MVLQTAVFSGCMTVNVCLPRATAWIGSNLDPDDIATQTQVFAVGIETLWLLGPDEVDRSRVESLFRRMFGTYLRPH
jgi:hypothetical protein